MGWLAVDVPTEPKVHNLNATPALLENEILKVAFAADGSIFSLYDKENQREVLPEGKTANRLLVYRDEGDAWDIPLDYAQQQPRQMQLVDSKAEIDGPDAILTQVYHLGYSELIQKIHLLSGSRCLEFETTTIWRETRAMLRTALPVAVHADEASFEIQFGHVRRPTHRNTTWDLARDEVPHQKWVDLSQRDYGAAVINDCKYGSKVKDGVIDLNLLRSVPFPGPKLVEDISVRPGEPHDAYTDQAEQHFRYAFYPHAGDAIAGNVTRAAYEFNIPLRVLESSPHPGANPASYSWLSLSASNVAVEAVKKAEDSDDIIIRLYETSNAFAQAKISFGFRVASVGVVDLLETPLYSLDLKGNSVLLNFMPFEIKTLCVKRAQP
jgi:alpha-mannosidase